MSTLQRSAVSFRRQGSSGRIWETPMIDQRGIKGGVSVACSHEYESVSSTGTGNALHVDDDEEADNEMGMRRHKTQRCGLSAVFGPCMKPATMKT